MLKIQGTNENWNNHLKSKQCLNMKKDAIFQKPLLELLKLKKKITLKFGCRKAI